MHQFHESHPAFSGFSKYYHQEILPQLVAWEENRTHKKFWAIPCLTLSTILCATLLYWTLTTPSKLNTYFAVAIAAVTNPLFVYRFFFSKFKSDVKDFLVSQVCSFTGLKYLRKSGARPPISTFKTLGIFPSSYRFEGCEDHIKGSFRGISFQAVEAHGETGRRDYPKKHTSMTFKFDLPHVTEGELVVLRKGDRKPANQLKLKTIGFAAPPFSHLFEVYGSDQVMSRFLLHPIFLERILYVEKVIDGTNARFSFTGQTLWICVETANRFEQGSMWTSFLHPRRTQFLIWEVASILHIVDGLVDLLQRPGRLVPQKANITKV